MRRQPFSRCATLSLVPMTLVTTVALVEFLACCTRSLWLGGRLCQAGFLCLAKDQRAAEDNYSDA
jgi:hypothetical protein